MYQFVQYKPNHKTALKDFLVETSIDYFPPLSERNKGIEGFVEKWQEQQGSAILALDKNQVIASLGYWETSGYIYIHWIGAIDQVKSSVVPFRLVDSLFEFNPDFVNKPDYSRTWSSNYRNQRFMDSIGGEKLTNSGIIEQIAGEDPIERESLYYVFNGDDIVKNLARFLRKK